MLMKELFENRLQLGSPVKPQGKAWDKEMTISKENYEMSLNLLKKYC